MQIRILSITSCRGGEEILLRIELREDAYSHGRFFGEEGRPRSEVRELSLLIDKYTELRPSKGEIDEIFFEQLVMAAEFSAAVTAGAKMLAFGANTKRGLAQKLVQKGYAREAAIEAAEYLADKGYISEMRDACREAENQVKKLRGRNRVVAALSEKGFDDDALSAALDYLDTVDFVERCATLIRKRYDGLLADADSRRKLAASLMRNGYTMREIREAMSTLAANS